jgi:hypothetical protein
MSSTLPSKTDPSDSITTYPDGRLALHRYEAEILSRQFIDIDPVLSLRQPSLPTF